jgi:hypothetical protein
MAGNSNYTHEIFSSRKKVPATGFVGQAGRIFYHEDSGELRISDGITPHGHPIYTTGGGGTGGAAELKFYVERGAPSMSPVAVDGALAIGDGSYSAVRGAVTQASGVFTSSGDAQLGSYVMRNITTTSAWQPLFLDGLAQKLIVPANSAMSFIINIIARRTDGSGSEGGVYEIRGGVDRAMTTISTRLIGTISKTVISEDNPIWDISALADGVDGALTLNVRGENGKTIRWVAHIQTIEVKT